LTATFVATLSAFATSFASTFAAFTATFTARCAIGAWLIPRFLVGCLCSINTHVLRVNRLIGLGIVPTFIALTALSRALVAFAASAIAAIFTWGTRLVVVAFYIALDFFMTLSAAFAAIISIASTTATTPAPAAAFTATLAISFASVIALAVFAGFLANVFGGFLLDGCLAAKQTLQPAKEAITGFRFHICWRLLFCSLRRFWFGH
jgi:hypothetical protein